MNRKYERTSRWRIPWPELLAFCMGVSILPLAWAVEPLSMERHDLPDGRVLFALKGSGVNVSEDGGITIALPGAGSGSGSASGGNTSGATTTAGKSAGSCTNVCEYWDQHANSGQGACLPLPEFTAVPGQPCKECDGKGQPRNKPDGTQCQPPNPGCCRGGNCISPRPLRDWADLQTCPVVITQPNYTPGHTEPACSVPEWGYPTVGGDPDRPGGFYFRDCCINHDKNYRTCGKAKKASDREFILCLLDVCDAAPLWKRLFCLELAQQYGTAVERGGTSGYRNGQVEGCACCDS